MSDTFKQLCDAELKHKQLKAARIVAEDRLQQATLREQRCKKEFAQLEQQLATAQKNRSNVEEETALAKALTEMAIQLRQQQCLQEAMKGEAQFAHEEAQATKLEIEMLHSKLRSRFGTAIATTPRGKMNNVFAAGQQQQSQQPTPGSTSDFNTSVIAVISEITQLNLLLQQNNNSININGGGDAGAAEDSLTKSSSSLIIHPLVPYAATADEVPLFSTWDSRATLMATQLKTKLRQAHQQLVSSLNVICNSCTDLSDDEQQWGSFVDMIGMAFFDTCAKLCDSALCHFARLLSGRHGAREIFAVSARLNAQCQVVFSPSGKEIGHAIRNSCVDRLLDDVFKFPHVHDVLTKKAATNFSKLPFAALLEEKCRSSTLDISRCIERIERDLELAHTDIVGEFGYAFAPDIVNLSSAQLFNTMLRFESQFSMDRWPLPHGALQVNCSAIFDTVLQLLMTQKNKMRGVERARQIEIWCNEAQESTIEGCRAPPPVSLVPSRSQKDDDFERLLKSLKTNPPKVVASPTLPEIWNRVAAPESTPPIPCEPSEGRSTPPPPGRSRVMMMMQQQSPVSESPAQSDAEMVMSTTKKKAIAAEEEQQQQQQQQEQTPRAVSRDNYSKAESLANSMKAQAELLSGGISRRPAAQQQQSQNTSNNSQSDEKENNNIVAQHHQRQQTLQQPPQQQQQQRPSTTPLTSSSGGMTKSNEAPLYDAQHQQQQQPAPQSLTPQEKTAQQRRQDQEEHEKEQQLQRRRLQMMNDSAAAAATVGSSSSSSLPPFAPVSAALNHHRRAAPRVIGHSNSEEPDVFIVGGDEDGPSGASSIEREPSVHSNNNNNVAVGGFSGIRSVSRSTTNSVSNHASPEPAAGHRVVVTTTAAAVVNNSSSSNNNSNHASAQRKSPTPPIVPPTQQQQQRNSNLPATNTTTTPARLLQDDPELEALQRREQENLDRMRANERKYQQLQMQLNNSGVSLNNSSNLLSNAGGSTPTPVVAHSARVVTTNSANKSNGLEREVAPEMQQIINERQQQRSNHSAPARVEGSREARAAREFSRPQFAAMAGRQAQYQAELEARKQQQQQESFNGDSSSLPAIVRGARASPINLIGGVEDSNNISSNNNSNSVPSARGSELDRRRIIAEREERDNARRAAEQAERAQALRQLQEEEEMERELARKLRAIEERSQSRAASQTRPMSSSSASNLPPVSGRGVVGASSSRPGSARNNNNNSSNIYSLANSPPARHSNNYSEQSQQVASAIPPPPPVANAAAAAAATTMSNSAAYSNAYGTPGSALRRKLSLPDAPSAASVSSASRTPLQQPPAVIVEPHECTSLSLLEIYKLACSRLQIKPNSGVVRMLPNAPGQFISSINLDTNYIGNRGFAPLLQVLRVNRGLQFLNLRDNNLESPQIQQLCVVLQGEAGEDIQQLNLSNNPITPAGATALCELIQKRSSLTSVVIKDTLIQGRPAEQVAELCLRNSLARREL